MLFFATVYAVLKFDLIWIGFGIFALFLYALPIVSTRDPFKAIPWEITLLLSSPMLLHISEGSLMSNQFAWWDALTSLAFAFSLSTFGFLLAVEMQMYTRVRMNRPFSVFFVVLFTLSHSCSWMLALYVGDSLFETTNLLSNDDVMREFLWILIGGILMGFLYAAYMRAMSDRRTKTLGFINVWEVKD